MLVISAATGHAMESDFIARLTMSIAKELENEGATPATARVCAEQAIERGRRYKITDRESLMGIATLLGTMDAEFDKPPSVLAALTNQRVPRSQRIARILASPALLRRIRALSPPGIDRRLRG